MLKAAFYQVEQCQEPPEEIRAEMQEFAADVGLGFHAFYMADVGFYKLLYGRTEGASGDEKARCPDFLLERTYA